MTPDEELANLIARRLVDDGLIDGGRVQEVMEKIAAGTATQDDWGFWVDSGPAGALTRSDATDDIDG